MCSMNRHTNYKIYQTRSNLPRRWGSSMKIHFVSLCQNKRDDKNLEQSGGMHEIDRIGNWKTKIKNPLTLTTNWISI